MKYRDAEKYFDNFKDFLRKKLKLSHKKEEKDYSKKQELFATLSAEDKNKLISPQLNFYSSAISKRSEIFPIISSLSATLIIITTLNKELVPLSSIQTKYILSFFLFLIPVTLHYYINEKEKVARNAFEVIASYQGKEIYDIFGVKSFLDQLGSDFPRILIYSFYGVVMFIIFKIWFV